jgi:hypothetical protein
MSEEVKSVHREPHPFVSIQHLMNFVGRTVAFVGKVDKVEDGTLYMKTADGKSFILIAHQKTDICAQKYEPPKPTENLTDKGSCKC